jgi:hypothetical protein
MTRLLHVDTLLAPLMGVSALAGLIYWTQARRWAYLLLSAGAGGLGLLTKAPAGYLPVFFALVGLVTLFNARRQAGPRPPCSLVTQWVVPLALWGLAAIVVYVALFPALWADPIQRGEDLATFLIKTGLEPHPSNFFIGRVIQDDPGPLYYLFTLTLRASPLAVLGVAGLVLASHQQEPRSIARWLLVYTVLFAVLMSLAAKKLDRYMLPALVLLDVAAGIGLWRIATFASTLVARSAPGASRIGRWLPFALVSAGVIGQALLLARTEPHPIAAYNPLAGGAERAGRVIMLGWGEGLEQVTAYLNSRPDSEGLLVATNYLHIVRPRLRGTSVPINLYFGNEPEQPLPTPDYIVLYINSVQRRQIPPIARRAIEAGPPVFIAQVNGQEYAWVYAVPSSEPRVTAPVPTNDASEKEDN